MEGPHPCTAQQRGAAHPVGLLLWSISTPRGAPSLCFGCWLLCCKSRVGVAQKAYLPLWDAHPAGTCPATHLHLCSALVPWLESPRGAEPAGPYSHRAGQHHGSSQWVGNLEIIGLERGVQTGTPEQRSQHVSASPPKPWPEQATGLHISGERQLQNKDQNKKHKSVTNCMNITRLLKEAVSTRRNLCPDQKGRG